MTLDDLKQKKRTKTKLVAFTVTENGNNDNIITLYATIMLSCNIRTYNLASFDVRDLLIFPTYTSGVFELFSYSRIETIERGLFILFLLQ